MAISAQLAWLAGTRPPRQPRMADRLAPLAASTPDPEFTGVVAGRRLAWIDRDGRLMPLAAPPRGYVYPRLSPDASRIVVDIRDEGHGLWEWEEIGRAHV